MTSLVIFLLTITLVGLLTSFMLMVHLRITAHGLTIKKNVLEKQLAEAKQALTQLQAENIDLKEHLTALQVRKETLQQYLTDQEKKATEDQQKLLFQFQKEHSCTSLTMQQYLVLNSDCSSPLFTQAVLSGYTTE